MTGLSRFQTSALAGTVFFLFSGVAWASSPPPGADVYTLDKPHTQILFSVGHLGYSQSWGKFLDYKGTIWLDRNHPDKASVEAEIGTASVDMGDAAWNAAVKKVFHPDQFPMMTYKSTSVAVTSKNTADINGTLTMLGVAKPVTLHATFSKADRNPFGKYVAGFSATADIKRSDFGMRDFITPAGAAVSDEVHIILEVEADRKDKPGQTQFNQ